MVKSNLLRATLAMSVCMIFAMAGTASAQTQKKKVTRDQAWEICRKEIQKEMPMQTTNQNQRFIRGGACMARFGHRL
jgi:hypothetical protein